MPVKTYSAKDHSIWFGDTEISGLADDFAVASRAEDAFIPTVSADGEVTRAKNANQMGSITITLKNSSASNDALSAAALADQVDGAGVKPIIVKDNFGTTVVSGAEAWVRKTPDVNRGKEVGDTEWVFDVAKLFIKPGGNTAA